MCDNRRVPDFAGFEGNPDFVLSLARGLEIIEAFQDRPDGVTVGDVASRTGLSRAAVRRSLITLELLGYAGHNGPIYRLGSRVLRLGFSFLSSSSLTALALPILEEMSAAIHESTSLSELEGNEIVYLARSATRRVMSVGLSIGSRLPAYCTSMGRVLLAAMPPAERGAYLKQAVLHRQTPKTIGRRRNWPPNLERVAETGLCARRPGTGTRPAVIGCPGVYAVRESRRRDEYWCPRRPQVGPRRCRAVSSGAAGARPAVSDRAAVVDNSRAFIVLIADKRTVAYDARLNLRRNSNPVWTLRRLTRRNSNRRSRSDSPQSALLARNSQLDPGAIDDVIYGCANQAGEDNRNVARMAALLAGLPDSVPGATVNRLCGSSLEAAAVAARGIRAGEIDLAIAGGVESMSRAPFVLSKPDAPWARSQKLEDTTLGWRFVNPLMRERYGVDSMGETAENVAAECGIARVDQDAFAWRSQQRTAAAISAGRLAEEIVPVEIPKKPAVDQPTSIRDRTPRWKA